MGGVSGTLHQDTVTISGYTVVGQAFGVCDVLSEDWPNDPADGVLGLGQCGGYQSKEFSDILNPVSSVKKLGR